MRFISSAALLTCLALSGVSWAQDAVVQGLGQATLAIEEDNTRLNLFNLGNPAGAAFVAKKNRMDLSFTLEPHQRIAEFATGADGSGTNVDPFGNSLTPSTIYTRQSLAWISGLNQDQPGGYGGALLSLNDEVTLQLIPEGSFTQRTSTDSGNTFREQSGGGTIRSSWLLDPHMALGAGISGSAAWESGWQEPDWRPGITDWPSLFLNYQRTAGAFGAEFGAVCRTESLFDAQDFLDLGVLARGERQNERTLFQPTDLAGALPNSQFDGRTLPWQAEFEGVYSFQSVMEVALVAGYRNQQWFHSLAEDGLPGEADHLSMNLDNLDYELSFRVRLPMVHNDDLRFGVAFNNRGFDHPYPTGRLLLLGTDGLYTQPLIETVSSSIGIGVAFVPAERSLITMEYHLGSSKSRQDQPFGALPDAEIIADSGFTRVAFGAQYALIENLVLRLGFSSLKISYQSHGTTVDRATEKASLITHATEVAGLSFGLGLDEGPFTFDLTVKGERTLNSPPGWTMLDKPVTTGDATQDKNQNLTTMLGVTWKMP